MGHICYSFGESTETSVMTGDTLFIGGCGKFFEGGAQEVMIHLLCDESDVCLDTVLMTLLWGPSDAFLHQNPSS